MTEQGTQVATLEGKLDSMADEVLVLQHHVTGVALALDNLTARLETMGALLWTIEDIAGYAKVSHMTVRRLIEDYPDSFPKPALITTSAAGGRPMRRWNPMEVQGWVDQWLITANQKGKGAPE